MYIVSNSNVHRNKPLVFLKKFIQFSKCSTKGDSGKKKRDKMKLHPEKDGWNFWRLEYSHKSSYKFEIGRQLYM